MYNEERKKIDWLVEQFWRRGYLTLSRRFGTYLPEPPKVGEFNVDIVARHKKEFAIGITLNSSDFKDNNRLIDKLNYLATRRTKYTNKRVLLFVGVTSCYFQEAKRIFEKLEPDAKINLKLFMITERTQRRKITRGKTTLLFA